MKALVLEAESKPRREYRLSLFEKKTGKAITGSSVWKNPRLIIKEIEKPKIGKRDLLIKVKNCGVCGSDIHFYERDKEGYMLYPGLTKFPCVIGHEFSGVVEQVGEDAKDFAEGDLVTSEEMIWCGECTPCRNGYPNHCERLEELGFTINGAFAEWISVGSKYCWKLNEVQRAYRSEVNALEAGALVEPTSVAYNGIFVRGEGFKPGDFVGVWGAGPIGLAAIALSKAAGASKIFAFETKKERRELAKRVGADFVFDPIALEEEGVRPARKIIELTQGQGISMGIEAAGAPLLTIPEIEKSLAINGKIVQIGRAAQKVPMYLERFQVRRAQFYGAQGHSGHGTFQRVIRLMASKRIDMRPIITSRFYLDHAIDAIEKASRRANGKVLVKI
jgi:hypothetical protein